MHNVHTCMLVCWALFQLLYRMNRDFSFFSIPFSIFNGNGFYVFAFHKTGVILSFLFPSPNKENLYPQNFSTTLVGWLVDRLLNRSAGWSPTSFPTFVCFVLIHQFVIFILILFAKVKVITQQKSPPHFLEIESLRLYAGEESHCSVCINREYYDWEINIVSWK